MKRICIYLTYDKKNVIDKYIGYMLSELRDCTDELIVVCNETDIKRGKGLLEEYADAIYYRENIGFDAGGFKDALCSFVGWDKVSEFDELVLVNDSLFGPFEKMEKIFSEMEERQADFWGLTKLGASLEEDKLIPEHIQTFFCAIRSSMLRSTEFREYWEKMPYYETFDAVVRNHEIKFTSYFSKLGYRYDVLADTEANDSKNIANNYLQYATICCELIKKRNFPFLKRQQITYNMQNLQTQENIMQALAYIGQETDYDVGLIWQNIIRTMNISDLYRNLHLRYILDGGGVTGGMLKAAVAVIADYGGAWEYVSDYLDSLEGLCDIYIISTDRDILAAYEGARYRKRFCDIRQCFWELIGELCQYECICIIIGHNT